MLATLRTPRGKAKRDGGLASVSPLGLLERLLAGLAGRTGLDPGRVDDVVIGCATQAGAQGGNLARTAVLTAGWPASVPGMTVNRFCSSGLDAVNVAAAAVRSGQVTEDSPERQLMDAAQYIMRWGLSGCTGDVLRVVAALCEACAELKEKD